MQATIVVGGYHWFHTGIRTIEAATDEVLGAARRDLVLTIYRLHDWRRFTLRMQSVLGRGVRVTALIDRWIEQPEASRRALIELAARYPSLFCIYGFRDPEGRGVLHAKTVAADSAIALIGSANLSEAAALWNYEMGVLVEGEAAAAVSRMLYALVASTASEQVIGD
jgi:phosphatidylserine/phosphatidylglycerophosphate/cardiolipin synthase-like enzyme